MTLEHDLERLALQEERLRFTQFDKATAWQLGCQLKALAQARQLALMIEVRIGTETVFLHAMDGTTPMNADWARRKRNTVELMQRSSYAVGRGPRQYAQRANPENQLGPADPRLRRPRRLFSPSRKRGGGLHRHSDRVGSPAARRPQPGGRGAGRSVRRGAGAGGIGLKRSG